MNINEKNLLEANLFRSFSNLVNKSSFHGIPNAFKSERLFTRLMWIFFTSLSTAICVWFCYKIVFNYSSYNKVTNIDAIYVQSLL